MRTRLLAILSLLAVIALVLAGGAAATDGGFSPVSPNSSNASGIADSYWLIFGLTSGIFLLVEVALIVFVLRFRSRGRPRDVEGPQIRGNVKLELAWTALPVVILAVIAVFVLYKLPGIKNVPSAQAGSTQLTIGVEGRQFYWQFRYPNGVIAIDRMRVPVGRVVRLDVSSPVYDVIHSWWIPALGGKIDAIPGHPNHTWFKAERTGSYQGQCAEFCGIQHAAMRAWVDVVPAAEFDRWYADQASSQSAGTSDLGAQEFNGACAKCHGPQGLGGIGPNITSSSVIKDRGTLATLLQDGKGKMPAVGKDWTDLQVSALFAYLGKKLGKAAPSGG
jgi:cytochrome c oxidase subunit II